ncbi:protein CBFA2T1-like isoform X1 [Pecten maximus]|uniref:protein CBFA2T1-like isoform X1 n=2 Tax=Pecten maximus TaxID=6579 RepID=UPI001458D33B|nr:protein CBFA2T1-like isoform X1 [Pecten maximus]
MLGMKEEKTSLEKLMNSHSHRYHGDTKSPYLTGSVLRRRPVFNSAVTLNYYRENIMPESPDPKSALQSPIASSMAGGISARDVPRPHSRGSTLSVNGTHSPLSGLNGRTPSPNLMVSSSVSQQLPPACGARQLSKLKRFLTTLQQFGSDISPEIGERVRTLVLGLVNSHLSIEEFHAKLQEATNFPLRPFVIPFLKANLPLLQRELLHCARMAKQTPQQFLNQNEHILFDASSSPIDSHDIPTDINENGKRRSPDSRSKDNGVGPPHSEPEHPAKRHHSLSPRVSPNGVLNLTAGPIRLEDISISRELRERERVERERTDREHGDRDREPNFSAPFNNNNFNRSDSFEPLERLDDDWRHVETMLNCIIGMVDKTKRALAVLQERSLRDREELSLWMRRHAEGLDQDMKKRSNDMMAHTLRHTEDRVSDVRRRAEEAVNEVKRQAMLELQKAVAAAEQKSREMVTAERLKMDQAVSEARKQAHSETLANLNHQEDSSESCWNCGRKASETCSGCNIARYCGSFCQHKDWENHHHVCGKSQVSDVRSDSSRSNRSQGPGLQSDSHPPATTQVSSPAHSTTSPTHSSGASRSSTPAETKSADAAH